MSASELAGEPRKMTGADLRRWRTDRGLSVNAAAKVMGYDKGQVSRWERGAHAGGDGEGEMRTIPRHVARKCELIDQLEDARAGI